MDGNTYVEVLLDTGADESFVSNKLSEDLGLVCKSHSSFEIYTFGEGKSKRTRCGGTTV